MAQVEAGSLRGGSHERSRAVLLQGSKSPLVCLRVVPDIPCFTPDKCLKYGAFWRRRGNHDERADWPFGRSEGLAAGAHVLSSPGRIISWLKAFRLIGEGIGRCSPFWQSFDDGQVSCALHTAVFSRGVSSGTPINLAASNLEYSCGGAEACGF